ncbi:MAG: GNVR domain-containing protein [Flavitalea sp.]
MSKLNLGGIVNYYLSYWRYFVLSSIVFIFFGAAYIYIATPIYEASASMLIKAEPKEQEVKNTPTLNLFGTKKILENEIEVIRSRTVLYEVVKNLKLYAPVSKKVKVGAVSAYVFSPVAIELRDPEHLIAKDQEKFDFSFDGNNQLVTLNATSYPLNTWINFGRGDLKFVPNPNYQYYNRKDEFFFSFVSVQKVADALLLKLDIQVPNKLATIIDLRLQDEVPKRCEDILNEIMKVYNGVDINDKTGLAKNALNFLDERIKLVEGELHSVETNLQQYRSNKGVVDISEQGKLYLGNAGRNDQDLGQLNIQLAILNQLEAYVVNSNKDSKLIPSMVGLNDPQLSILVEKLYNREAEFSRLKDNVGENNPIAVSFRNEIDKIKSSIKESISGQKKNLEISKNNLSMAGGQLSTTLKAIPQRERELLEISRQQTIKNEIYTFLLQKREEAALSYASTVPDNRIVDFAKPSILPVKPKKQLIYLISFFLGIGVVGAWLYAKNLYKPLVSGGKDILDRAHVPFIGEVSHIKKYRRIEFSREIDTLSHEEFRKVRTSLNYYYPDTEKHKILITSASTNEGKLFVATNLAFSFTALNKKVLLINLDVTNPDLDSIFNTGNNPGLLDWLSGNSDVSKIVQQSKIDTNLYIIPTGDHVNKSTDLFLDGMFANLFFKLQANYDEIIVISSPLNVSSDAYLISQWCTATLFVVRQGHTPLEEVKNMNSATNILKFTNASILLNDAH